MMKIISPLFLPLLLTVAAARVSTTLNSNSNSNSNSDIIKRRLFKEGPPSLTVFGELDEDLYCRCEAHNCFFNPSPYAVDDLKLVVDAFDSTSVISSACTGTGTGNDDDSIGCLQFNQTKTVAGTGTLFRENEYVDMVYVNRASASCACPDGSVLSAAVINGNAVKGAKVQTGVVVQSSSTDASGASGSDSGVTVHSNHPEMDADNNNSNADYLLVNYPGVGYCVDNSLEEALFQRPPSMFPNNSNSSNNTARTSIQIQPITPEQLQSETTHHQRLAVAACCREGEFGHEHADCTATPMVNHLDVLTFSIEAFQPEWLDRQDSPYACALVTAVNNAKRMCVGGGRNGNDDDDDDGQDELCVEGDAVLVCRPPTTMDGIMEIGCPNTNYMLAYNGFLADYGVLTKGYQMRSPQGYQNSLVPALACIQGNLQYSRFDHQACQKNSQFDNNDHMNITHDNGAPPPPPAKRIDPITGNLELIDASGNVIVDNLPNGREKPGMDNSDSIRHNSNDKNNDNDNVVDASSSSRVCWTNSVLGLAVVVAVAMFPSLW